MRPLDPRVLPHLAPARGPLAVVVAASTAGAVLLVVQAFALAATVARLVADPVGDAWHGPALVFALALLGRAVTAYVGDVAAARAAVVVGVRLRDLVLGAVLRPGPAGVGASRTGELGVLATRGVAAVEPYLTRYLPALVLAVVLPVVTVAAIAWLDWASALVVVLTLPLLPVFAVLIGMTTRERADRQWQVLSQLAGHFVDVVRGLPTLVAHRRARAQAPRIREVTERYRRANRDVLRLAFASSAALELIATISVALVAVLVGLRLAGGGLGLETALTVLLLAPEAYWPVRRVGAEFHSAAEGTATFEEIHALLSQAPAPTGGRRAAPAGDLCLDGLSVTWPGRTRPALDGLSAVVPAQGLTVVTGPSGCGKSTLLAALRGEVDAARGAARGGRLHRRARGRWRGAGRRRPARLGRAGGGRGAAAVAARHDDRGEPAPGSRGRRRRGAVGRAARGRARRRRGRPARRARRGARRGRRRALRRPAGPPRHGAGRGRRPALRAPRRADGAPRRRHGGGAGRRDP